MGLVYLPTFTIFFPLKTTIHVGKYTSPMDGMGNSVESDRKISKSNLTNLHSLLDIKVNGGFFLGFKSLHPQKLTAGGPQNYGP